MCQQLQTAQRLSVGLVSPKEAPLTCEAPSGSTVSKSQPGEADSLQVLLNISWLFANNNNVILIVWCVKKILLHIIYALYLQYANTTTT